VLHVSANTDLTTKTRRLRAGNVRETAGAVAVVSFREGSASGNIVVQLRFAAVTGGSDRTFDFSHPGLTFSSGVFVEVASGTVRGSVELLR
jgi:hypothetical protein